MDMNRRMRDGMTTIDRALARAGILEGAPEYEAIRNEYQYMCYLLAETTAVAKAFEDCVKDEDKELFLKAANPRRNLAKIMKQIRTVLPVEWQCGDEDDDGKEDET